jgi:hypothetical protein
MQFTFVAAHSLVPVLVLVANVSVSFNNGSFAGRHIASSLNYVWRCRPARPPPIFGSTGRNSPGELVIDRAFRIEFDEDLIGVFMMSMIEVIVTVVI